MTRKEMAVGTSFVVAAVALAGAIAFSVASMPAYEALRIPAGTVIHSPQLFMFSVGPGPGRLTGAWTSNALVGTRVDYAYDPGGNPTGGIGGKVHFGTSGELNLSIGPGFFGIFFLGNASVTVTQTIQVAYGA